MLGEPVDGDAGIVEVFEVVFDGKSDHVRPAVAKLPRGRIRRIDHRVRQSRCHLLGHGSTAWVEASDRNLLHIARKGTPDRRQGQQNGGDVRPCPNRRFTPLIPPHGARADLNPIGPVVRGREFGSFRTREQYRSGFLGDNGFDGRTGGFP